MPEGPRDPVGSGGAPDIELRHARLERRRRKPEESRGTVRPAYPPSGVLENPHDVGTLDVLQQQTRRSGRSPALRDLDPQHRFGAQDHGPFDDVPQLADVAGPRVSLQLPEVALVDRLDSLPLFPATSSTIVRTRAGMSSGPPRKGGDAVGNTARREKRSARKRASAAGRSISPVR